MPARDDQADAGIDLAVGIGELAGVEVAFEVVDGDQRDVERQGQRLGRGQADDQRPDQPRPGRDGDRAEVAERRRPARVRASSITGRICRTCAREAISGTTPPNRSCRSICEATTLERIARHARRRRPRPFQHRRAGLVAGRLDGQEQEPVRTPERARVLHASREVTSFLGRSLGKLGLELVECLVELAVNERLLVVTLLRLGLVLITLVGSLDDGLAVP